MLLLVIEKLCSKRDRDLPFSCQKSITTFTILLHRSHTIPVAGTIKIYFVLKRIRKWHWNQLQYTMARVHATSWKINQYFVWQRHKSRHSVFLILLIFPNDNFGGGRRRYQNIVSVVRQAAYLCLNSKQQKQHKSDEQCNTFACRSFVVHNNNWTAMIRELTMSNNWAEIYLRYYAMPPKQTTE